MLRRPAPPVEGFRNRRRHRRYPASAKPNKFGSALGFSYLCPRIDKRKGDYGRQFDPPTSGRTETQIRGVGAEAHRPRSDRRRETVRAAEQGLQGAGTDHRDVGTFPHGPGQSGRSEGRARQRQGRGDARNGARGDRRTGTGHRTHGGGDQTAAHPQRPAGFEERHHGDSRRHGRRRSGALRRRPVPHVYEIHRIEGVALRGDLLLGGYGRRIQGGGDEGHRAERLRYAQIRIGRPPRAARPRHRDAGARPHLGRFGGRSTSKSR